MEDGNFAPYYVGKGRKGMNAEYEGLTSNYEVGGVPPDITPIYA